MWKKKMIILLLVFFFLVTTEASYPISKTGCSDKCGNISVPYPFGIGLHCAFNPSFNLSCDPPNNTLYSYSLYWESTMSGFPTILPVQISAVDLDLLTTPPSPTLAISTSYNKLGLFSNDTNYYNYTLMATNALDMRGSPYTLMPTRNILLARGCGGSIVLKDANGNIVTGCSTVCHGSSAANAMGFTGCYGIGCCQTSVAASADYFMMEFLTIPQMGNSIASDFIESAVFDAFAIDNKSVDQIFSERLRFRISKSGLRSTRIQFSRGFTIGVIRRWKGGYTGQCRYEYYEGNPYLPNGCRVNKECQNCPISCALMTRNSSNTTAHHSSWARNWYRLNTWIYTTLLLVWMC